MKKIISLLLIVLLICGCTKSFQTIDRNKAQTLLDDGAILIDVRSNEEYANGHIDKAINIPLEEINTIKIDKDKVIILYCATGVRSAEAAKIVISLGYEYVYNLDGGLLNWGDE